MSLGDGDFDSIPIDMAGGPSSCHVMINPVLRDEL